MTNETSQPPTLVPAFSQERDMNKMTTAPCSCCGEPSVMKCDPISAFIGKPKMQRPICQTCEAELSKAYQARRDQELASLNREFEENARRKRLKAFNELCPIAMRELNHERLPEQGRAHSRVVLDWNFPDGQGLIMTGRTGRGKTRLAWQLTRRLIVDEELDVLFISASDIARAAAFMVHEPHTYRTLIRRSQAVDVLFIDDLGVERSTTRFQSDISDLVSYRADRRLPVVITTNYRGTELGDRFEDAQAAERFLRRLAEFYHVIDFNKS